VVGVAVLVGNLVARRFGVACPLSLELWVSHWIQRQEVQRRAPQRAARMASMTRTACATPSSSRSVCPTALARSCMA